MMGGEVLRAASCVTSSGPPSPQPAADVTSDSVEGPTTETTTGKD